MPGASGQFNGQISGPSAGKRQIRAMDINYGITIVATSDEARSRRAFYPLITTVPAFTLTVGFVSWEERERFNQWMSTFMTKISEGTVRDGSLTIRVPSRDFIRTCVVQGDLEYGEGVGDLAYTTTLSFIGASDPTDPTLGAKARGASYYQSAANDSVSQFFYPAAQQIKGAEAADSTTFGDTPDGANFVTNPTFNKPQVLPGGEQLSTKAGS